MCPKCSKPSRLCLCTRIKTPSLDNSVAVTILQHALERNHPLNSTRIAAIGLKNLDVVSVSDVNSEARFAIHLPESDGIRPGKDPIVTFTIRKSGVCSSLAHHLTPRSQSQPPNLDTLLASPPVLDALGEGFVVKKWRNSELNRSIETEESEEFEIAVTPGSVLLFPSEKSVGITAMDVEVKKLIVLDGTWAKAKRMYSENPWLKVLPHLKLDLEEEKGSLYGEVRHQPRAGCLSTIESIVYGLKAVGDGTDGLDNLLEAFESMVGDQRRCKDERLSKIPLRGVL